ncbi:hypothetical protein GCM10009734_62700 [Nonomuraea bangladeshensis]
MAPDAAFLIAFTRALPEHGTVASAFAAGIPAMSAAAARMAPPAARWILFARI